MLVKFPKRYYLVFAFLALITAIAVYWGTSRIIQQEEAARTLNLERANREAAKEFQEALNNYATLISGVKSYIEISNGSFTENDISSFIERQLGGLIMERPFSVSYIDTSHIFIFDFTMQPVPNANLVGKSIAKFIGKEGTLRMDSLMRKSNFYASDPTNLLEGRVGLPLGFGVLDSLGNSMGYITSIAEFAPILDKAYVHTNKDDFVFKFKSSNGNYFDRSRAHNGQKIYSVNEDPEFFKNFDVKEETYISSVVPFYNKEFILSTAYKKSHEGFLALGVTSCLWYLAILGFMFFLISQYYLYERKNKIIASQKVRLSELVATKNKFFSILANDLRGPLSSVINFLDVLKVEHANNNQNTTIINSLEDSSRNSISLLDNLLKWSKLQTDQVEFTPVALDIMSITKDQIKIQNHALQNKGLNIRLESSFKGEVVGDKNMVATIIRNVLSNAIKFSHDNDIIVIELTRLDNKFVFSIEDNGIGIPEHDKQRLFDLTEITSRVGTRNEKGSGLGLVLSNEYLKAHRGDILIESEDGKGTLVTFTLPLG
ncbi:sensor histidine kinase [Dokdonia sp. 4H-3-7-5]|uniref:sensor histidine kinase n=1 Tax=Dokdonia sp. (strain 4H-3-7-5) TaxID=983548 RepID=UPI00020A6D86|nr:HAMP domain-containing sensor histidine kinase [Dokdonia sp. 4H-3-7-5]AEE19084.1 integral membrane sensor signal transduction histidine kinase [Dokdonia sp. 4H-3-7-5]